jgi:hypothetical protein
LHSLQTPCFTLLEANIQYACLQVPNATYIDGLVTMHCALGVRYIIGLPLYQNAPQLTLAVKNAFDTAFARFPRAILSYELGNEPNFWPTKEGGFTPAVNPTRCSSVTYNDPSFQLVATLQPVTGPADKAAGTTTAVRIEKTDDDGKDRRKLLWVEGEIVQAATAVEEVELLEAGAEREQLGLPGAAIGSSRSSKEVAGDGKDTSLHVLNEVSATTAAEAKASGLEHLIGAAAEGGEAAADLVTETLAGRAIAVASEVIEGELVTGAEVAAVVALAPEEVEATEVATVTSAAKPVTTEPAEHCKGAGHREVARPAAAEGADTGMLQMESAGTARSLHQVQEMPYVPTYALYRPYQRPWTPYFPQGFCFTQQVTQFRSGFPAYLEYFNKTANAITGCGGPQTAEQVAWGVPYWGPPGFNRKSISGPSWGNLNIGAENFSNFVRNAGAR